jgi:hypothetical protein
MFQVIVFLLGCSLLGKRTAYCLATTVALSSHCPYMTSISKYSEEVNIAFLMTFVIVRNNLL